MKPQAASNTTRTHQPARCLGVAAVFCPSNPHLHLLLGNVYGGKFMINSTVLPARPPAQHSDRLRPNFFHVTFFDVPLSRSLARSPTKPRKAFPPNSRRSEDTACSFSCRGKSSNWKQQVWKLCVQKSKSKNVCFSFIFVIPATGPFRNTYQFLFPSISDFLNSIIIIIQLLLFLG